MLSVDTKGDTWTFGVEHELSDWDCSLAPPGDCKRSPDYTIVNSNGIAAQPNTRVYGFGGEINTPPTSNIDGQAECLSKIRNWQPVCSINHRSNLHIHIRVPGLSRSLKYLKLLQKYVHEELPKVINNLEPIPRGNTDAEKKRERRRKVSHHTFLTKKRLEHQLAAKSVQDFFEREVPKSRTGKVMWHAQPRVCVNLRQILQTDTIEFRHFPGTLDTVELSNCLEWCNDFILYAFYENSIERLWSQYRWKEFPKFPKLKYDREVKYQATASHNGLKQSQIKHNIQLILNGEFHGSKEEQAATKRACGMSR